MKHRDDWPDEILEADVGALPGQDASPAARRGAERVARDTRNLNALLSAMADRLDDGLPAAAEARAAHPRRRPSRRWRVLAPLAAAAAVATLILVRGDENENGERDGPLATAAPSMVSEMDVAADKPFVVFPTNDPNMAVVWLLDLEESE